MTVSTLLPVLQLILAFGNICVLIWALWNFLRKPHDNLAEKINTHELKLQSIERSLLQGNDRFREQDAINGTFKSVMLSFVDFEIAYCIHTGYEYTEDLMNARRELQEYLARKQV